jgi:hypothetical protein
MRKGSCRFLVLLGILFLTLLQAADAQLPPGEGVLPNPNQHKGVYVTSFLGTDGQGHINVQCNTEAIDRSTNPPTYTPAFADYSDFSTYCTVSSNGSDGASIATIQSQACTLIQELIPSIGYGVEGTGTGDCQFSFTPVPGNTYTLTSLHYILIVSGPCIVVDPNPHFDENPISVQPDVCGTEQPDPEGFWPISQENLSYPTSGAWPQDDTQDMVGTGTSGKIPTSQLNSAGGGFVIATTNAQFAPILLTPTTSNLFQTQEVDIAVANIGGFQTVTGNSDTVFWCLQSSPGPCGAPSANGSATVTGTPAGTLTAATGSNIANYTAPDTIPVTLGGISPTDYVCAQDTATASTQTAFYPNYSCVPINLTELTMTMVPDTVTLSQNKPLNFRATINGSAKGNPCALAPNTSWWGSISSAVGTLAAGMPLWIDSGNNTDGTWETEVYTPFPNADTGFELTASADVNLGCTNSSTTSIGGNTVTLTATATVTVDSSLQSQTITFPAISNQTFGTSPPSNTLAATASSGLTVQYFSQTPAVCSISGPLESLVLWATGTCTIEADQFGGTVGDVTYAAAAPVTQSFQVTTAPQTISFTAPVTTTTYGVAPITLTATGGSSSQPVVFNVVSGHGTISGNTLTITGAGTVVVAANQAGNADYAAAPQVTQSITVSKAPLTVNDVSVSMTYGGTLPAFSVTTSGLVNGDTVGGTLTVAYTCTPACNSTSPAGTYTVRASVGGASAGNYTIKVNVGNLTIKKAALTVTANNLTMVQGAAVPPLTYTIAGFVNSDAQALATTGAPSLTTTATSASAVGTYPITAKVGTLAAANYSFQFVNGTLTVTSP